ncbi:G2/M phase-specific E3 ubiquitin-protein ligase [Triplophysa tibetana]|uniref:G2/M phase-specific E3 ubiquitin-protein ligase n=1 Tax=Triplophysa tibetana TaxID=1572043 RepID=A0A5A9PSS7_9TELE|nr:G2/M phase-specific E3 ubiquitin-protein ligase [Triplophysa tibetana]
MSSDHESQSAVFDRVFSSISRARRELSINSQDNLLSSTRRLFRRHITSRKISRGMLCYHRQGPPGRQENAVWQIHLFLLPGPDIEVLPSTSALDRFGNLGLGRPVQESSGTGTQKSKIQLNWTLSELNNFVCQSYPNVSLNLIAFHLARAGKGRKIDKVHVDSEMTPSSSISQNPVQTSCTTAALDDTSLDAEITEAVNLDSLQEWRAMRSQQDEEFNFSLLADQEKISEERRQRMAARVEPLEGEFLKFKYPDGYVNKRKFITSEPIQVLFDFIGQNELASEVFPVQEAASSKAIESSSSGSIADHGIKSSSTLYVLWLSSLADLAPVAPSPAQPSVATPPVQHPAAPSSALPPVALPSVHPSISPPLAQPSVPSHSVIPLLTLPPIRHPAAASPGQPTAASSPGLPSVASLSAIPLVAPSPVQHPVALPPAQSSLALSSVQLPYVISEDQPLPCRPSAQPNIIDLDMQPTLDPPSPQGSVIDLLDDAPSFHQESPLHWEAPVDEVDLQTILKKLLCKVDKSFCPTSNQINVCRDNILQCSLQAFKRRWFNPEAKLDIVFVDAEENGEGAVDEGGPTREYLRLLMRAIHQSSIFQGHEKDQSLALDTQGECNAITLQMIMEFATGASSVPPLGFPYSPQIEFLHDHGKIFPEANTCLVVLRLPIHAEYEMFKRYMTDGIVQSPTFGVV